MKLPDPPIMLEGETIKRGKQTVKPGDHVKFKGMQGEYVGLFRDKSGGVYARCVHDSKNYSVNVGELVK